MRLSGSVVLAMLTLAGRMVGAQAEGPAAGSWGVEGGAFSGGSLLHFHSTSSAMVIGASAFVTRSTGPGFDPATGQIKDISLTLATTQLRLGFRRYGESHDRVRRFSTISAIVGYERSGNPGVDAMEFGGAAEMGAAYFFSPHVSMGGSGEAVATYANGGLSGRGKRVDVTFPGLRLLGAIYF